MTDTELVTTSVTKRATRTKLAVDIKSLMWSAIGLGLLQTAHLVFRDKLWVVEVSWGVVSYLFSMIFFGPAAAGVGAIQGRQFRKVAWLARTRPTRTMASFFAPTLLTCWAMFGAGLLVVVGIATIQYNAPLELYPGHGFDIGIAFLAIAGLTAVGFAVGTRWSSVLVPAVVTAGAFVLTMWGWLAGFEILVRFGSVASQPLLVPNPTFQIARVLTYSIFLVIAFGCALSRMGSPKWAARAFTASFTSLILVILWAGSVPYKPFLVTKVQWTCDASGFQDLKICVPSTFERFLEPLIEFAHTEPTSVVMRTLVESEKTPSVLLVGDPSVFSYLIQSETGNAAGRANTLNGFGAVVTDSMLVQTCFLDKNNQYYQKPAHDWDPRASERVRFWVGANLMPRNIDRYWVGGNGDLELEDATKGPPSNNEAEISEMKSHLATLPACPSIPPDFR